MENKEKEKMTLYLACARAEGEGATEEQQIEAWQWLVDEKHVWKLQGWYGRTARDLINEGIIKNYNNGEEIK
jgi:hypothetical protein